METHGVIDRGSMPLRELEKEFERLSALLHRMGDEIDELANAYRFEMAARQMQYRGVTNMLDEVNQLIEERTRREAA